MIKSPRLLYIITNLRTGGAEKYVLETAQRVSTKGFSTSIVALGEIDQRFIRSLKMHSESVVQFITPKIFHIKSIGVLYKLVKYIKRQKINIIHVNLLGADILGGLAAIFSKRSFVSTQHNTRPWRYDKNIKNRIYLYLYRFIMFFCSVIITPTESVKTYLMETTKIKPNRIRIIYHGIDLDRFQTKFKKMQKKITIGCLATLRTPKGQTYIIDALPTVISRIEPRQIQLLFAGDGPDKATLVTKTRELKLCDKIKFLGRIYDVPKFLSEIDILVHGAISGEAFCYAALEGLAMGKAVVATHIDGLPEFIKDHWNGILVPTKSSDMIAKSLVELIRNPQLFEEISTNAALSVRNFFSINRTISETVELYEQILNDFQKRERHF